MVASSIVTNTIQQFGFSQNHSSKEFVNQHLEIKENNREQNSLDAMFTIYRNKMTSQSQIK